MPDAPGLELIRQEIEERHEGAVLDTSHAHDRAVLIVDSGRVLDVLRWLRDTPGQEYRFLSSLHAADYLPAEPRFAVHYELLSMARVERLSVKALLADPAATNGNPARNPAEPEAGARAREDGVSGRARAGAEDSAGSCLARRRKAAGTTIRLRQGAATIPSATTD